MENMNHREVGIRICEALGLNPDEVTELHIHILPFKPIEAVATIRRLGNRHEELIEVFKSTTFERVKREIPVAEEQ